MSAKCLLANRRDYVLLEEHERLLGAAFKEAERYRQLWLLAEQQLKDSAPKGSRVHEPAASGVASGEGNDPATGAELHLVDVHGDEAALGRVHAQEAEAA